MKIIRVLPYQACCSAFYRSRFVVPRFTIPDLLFYIPLFFVPVFRVLPQSLSSLGVYYISVSSYKDCYPTAVAKNFFDIFLWFNPPQREGFFVLEVSVSRFTACYPTTIGKDFLLWFGARSPPMRQKGFHLKWVSQV